MAFCRNCGAQLEENIKFCANCGCEVENVAAAARRTDYTAEYDALDLTASAYDAYDLTAFQYDFEGKIHL